MKNKTVSILGTPYTIKYIDGKKHDKKLEGMDGYTDVTTKEIVIDTVTDHLDDALLVKDMQQYIKSVVRHEVIHAFIHESGLASCSAPQGAWAINEEMVDFFALQWHKIAVVYNELGV